MIFKLMLAVALGTLVGCGFMFVTADAMTGGLTPDMIWVALSSAHINKGSQTRLLDRTTGQWHDWRLNGLTVRTNGNHATIDLDATRLN